MEKQELAMKLYELSEMARKKNNNIARQCKKFAGKIIVSDFEFNEPYGIPCNEIFRGYALNTRTILKNILIALLNGRSNEDIVECLIKKKSVDDYESINAEAEHRNNLVDWHDGDNLEEYQIMDNPSFGYWHEYYDDIEGFK